MKRILWTVFWILTATMVCSAQTTFYYPQIVNGILSGDHWHTTIFLANNGSTPASGTITFVSDTTTSAAFAGNYQPGLASAAFSIGLKDDAGVQTSSSTVAFSLAPGQTKKYVSDGAGAYIGGAATVTTSAGTVTGTAIFSHFDSTDTRLIAEAGVPSATAATKQAIFVDTSGGYHIGLAIANTSGTAANITMTLMNTSGVAALTTPLSETLGSKNHDAFIVSTPGEWTGSLQISSTAALAAIALRFDPAFGVFTTLPPFTLASLGSMYPTGLAWLDAHPWLSPLSSVARLLGSIQFSHV
jgi:hypothetical protein